MTVFQWLTIVLLLGVTLEAWGARRNARKAIQAAEDAKREIQALRQMLEQQIQLSGSPRVRLGTD
ncbi:hypothetical protein [Stenotrophomonas sp. BIGb0135]|uniref:hypothetical protein n=1 Tax=Stenotrophomonas sp. BIGb0135 TaxID=2940620 RepID=UPI002167ADA1|nr:hypothetical protein [Stenotrophomonas sp. BIGb0135]MCS4234446.1 membrane protein required for beta-lactamase induction [Stenotrophomonas sp. BIGb0135]